MMKLFDSRSNVLKRIASSEYEYDDEDYEYENLENEDSEDEESSWEEAIDHYGVFYGDDVIIALICREQRGRNYKEGVLIKPLKWRIVTREGRKWAVAEEHPFNCGVEAIFGEYGLPTEFKLVSGYYNENGVFRHWN
jgi:hypothetical protein